MRQLIWLILWIIGAVVLYKMEIAQSQAAYDAGHKSAFAWHGFLPFFIPIFLAYSAVFVVPLMCVVEFVIWIRKRK